ncbi:RES family NAD+ phosphorylase [Fibrella aquatica]|uniref:RES family NAD+ phosphorylase n=1 Tax=Fibrella aquatica TaxID=3242487 RepID=UPI0035206756
MNVYRLASARRANDLSGEGARRVGGRWNSIGTAVVYTASSRALATLEVLVHTPLAFVPDNYRMLTLSLPEDSIQTLPLDRLPKGWNGLNPPLMVKQLIDKWIYDNQFLVLKVPSAVVEGDFNLLINPMHPRMSEVQITDNRPYTFDTRLFRS